MSASCQKRTHTVQPMEISVRSVRQRFAAADKRRRLSKPRHDGRVLPMRYFSVRPREKTLQTCLKTNAFFHMPASPSSNFADYRAAWTSASYGAKSLHRLSDGFGEGCSAG